MKTNESNRGLQLGLVIIAAFVLLLTVALFPAFNSPQALAAPPAAPTPVAAPDSVGGGHFFRFQPATAIAADTYSPAVEVLGFETLDIEYALDHGTANTTTLTVQYSISGDNWTDGAALVSASASDAAAVVARVPVFGRYMRVKQDVTNTNTITITLLAVGR